MSKSEERYVTISTTFLKATDKAIQIDTTEGDKWIARSCLHYSSDQEVDVWRRGDEVEIQVFHWVAEKHNL